MMSLTGWRGGGGTSLQPYPLPEEILLSRGLGGTPTRERDEGRDGGPGGRPGGGRGLSTSSQRETSVNMRGRRREGDVGDSSLFHANIMTPQARQYRKQSITRRPQHSKHSKRLAFQTTSLSPGRFVPAYWHSWPPKRCKLNRCC